jgi:hypothetical protein
MAKASKKSTGPTNVGVSGGTDVKGGFDVSSFRAAFLNIDAQPEKSQAWVEGAVKRLKAGSDCPQTVTEAARRLQQEMVEAYARRQCAELWTWQAIKNMLTAQGYWPRIRPKR